MQERGYYALALDGARRKVDSVTSDAGHLMWSGIVPPERVRLVAETLMDERLFSGWGVRTMAEGEGTTPNLTTAAPSGPTTTRLSPPTSGATAFERKPTA
jgi:hypothetical protein